MERGAWWATAHGVTKSGTRLSDFTFTFHFHALEKEMATQAPLFMEFSSKEYRNGLPFPSPEGLPEPGIKPGSPALQTDFLHLSHHESINIIFKIK